MISFELYHELRRLHREEALTPAQIAARLGIDIKTVRKHLKRLRYEKRQGAARRSSKLDPYKDLIVAWLEKHPFTGMQIYQRLRREHGYAGGKTILNDYLTRVRPVRREAFLKLAFEPGDCLQVDWGTHGMLKVGQTVRKLHCLSAAHCANQLAAEIKRYETPKLLVLDELGYLPLDKRGGELLFQIISKRYERASTVITSNIAFEDWPRIFAGRPLAENGRKHTAEIPEKFQRLYQ